MSNYYVLGRTSPLTYQVLGHVKTIATIGFSVVVFGLETNAKNLLGLFVAMVGVVSYTEVTRRASVCLLYTSPSPRDATLSRMPSSA